MAYAFLSVNGSIKKARDATHSESLDDNFSFMEATDSSKAACDAKDEREESKQREKNPADDTTTKVPKEMVIVTRANKKIRNTLHLHPNTSGNTSENLVIEEKIVEKVVRETSLKSC